MFRPILASLVLALATPALAAPPATPVPADGAAGAEEAAAEETRESPDWFTESSVFSRAPGIPENTPFWERGAGNVPIVGTDADGNYVDVRNGRPLTEEEADAAIEANDLGGTGPAVTVFHVETSASKGINRGKFEDGSWELASGKLGSVSLDAGSAWGYGAAGVAVGEGGVRAGAVTGGTLTAIGLTASTKTVGFGKEDSLVQGVAEGLGYAMVGADASAGATARAGLDGLAIGAQAGAFVGASAGVSGIGELSVGGVAVRVIAGATAGYGLGANADAFFKVDWADMSVRIGGSALAGLGPSAGASIDVEISLAGLMKRIGVTKALAKGVKKVASTLKNAALSIASGLGFLDGPAPDGTAVARDANTKANGPTGPPGRAAKTATGAGMLRD